ncbi:hypothetical protein ElyMa_003764500 [Elysia marginata]|uniref:Uncharacterized protein n=1 Tax=Elysia marginata TaxID=1093978 RepID=A0AAV4F9P4_9GAST|nr:hypothetical protein ElyMa_003764500 [Elysia marginata]
MDHVVSYLADNFTKLTKYADLGFQVPVSIPPHVQRAYSILATQIQKIQPAAFCHIASRQLQYTHFQYHEV